MSDDPASGIDLPDQYDLFVDGEFAPAESGDTLTTLDPATEEPLTAVAAGKAADVDRAVAGAREAFDAWRKADPVERSRTLRAVADAVLDEKERLARLETLDSGKPLSQTRGDVEDCARYFEYYAGAADKLHGDSIPLSAEYVDYTVREPLGVTGQIIPWNFPLALCGRSIAPALAAGNVAVAKPAEQTPLTALELGRIAHEAGLPAGALQVVPGYGTEAGAALAGHADVDGVSFTGSVVTGRAVAKMAVDNVTPVHLELGGKSPNVVFPDADLDHAADEAIAGIFTTMSGQVCSAASRLLLHEEIHDEFLDRLVARTEELSVGPGLDDHDLGPLISKEQYDKVCKYVGIGREEVGDPVVGGEALDRDGYFVEPTVFDGVDNDARIAQEEIFGPVLSVITFGDEDEAIDLANDVEYGLVAGIFTADVGRAHRFAREVRAGQIYVNEWFAGGVETPFGGFEGSGFGREKGLEALEEYTQVKNVCARIDR